MMCHMTVWASIFGLVLSQLMFDSDLKGRSPRPTSETSIFFDMCVMNGLSPKPSPFAKSGPLHSSRHGWGPFSQWEPLKSCIPKKAAKPCSCSVLDPLDCRSFRIHFLWDLPSAARALRGKACEMVACGGDWLHPQDAKHSDAFCGNMLENAP